MYRLWWHTPNHSWQNFRSRPNPKSNKLFNSVTIPASSMDPKRLMKAPTLLTHQQLHVDDKNTWDEAYRQEYQGIVDIDTWETITETEYNKQNTFTKASCQRWRYPPLSMMERETLSGLNIESSLSATWTPITGRKMTALPQFYHTLNCDS